jgi:hypothetical protein
MGIVYCIHDPTSLIYVGNMFETETEGEGRIFKKSYLSFYVCFFIYIGSMIAATILTVIFCVVSLVRFMENHKYA